MRLRSVLNRLPVFLLIFGLLLFASFFWTTLHGSIDEEKHEIKVSQDEADALESGRSPGLNGRDTEDLPDDDLPDDDLPDVDDDEDFDSDEEYDDDEAYEEAKKALADAAPDEEAEDEALKALAAEDDDEGSAEEARAEEQAEEEALKALAAEDDDGSPPIAPQDTQGGGGGAPGETAVDVESPDEPPAGQPAKGTGADSSESDYFDETARDAESEQSAAKKSGEGDYQGYEEDDGEDDGEAPVVELDSTKESVDSAGAGESGATEGNPSADTAESAAKESDGSEEKKPQDTAGSKGGTGGQKSPAADKAAEPLPGDGEAGALKPADDVDDYAQDASDLFLPEGLDAEGHDIKFSPQYRPPEKQINHNLLDLTNLEAGFPECFDSMPKPKTFLYFMSSHTGSTAMMSQLLYHPETHWVHGLGTMEPLNRPGMTNDSRAEVAWTRGFFGDAVKLDRLAGFKLNLSPIHTSPDEFAMLVREFDTAIILNTRKNLLKRAVGRYPFYYMHDSTTVAGLRHGTTMEERCDQGIGCQYAVRPNALHCLMARSYFVMEELRTTVEDLTKAAGKPGCFLEAPYEDYLYYPDETIVQIEKFLHLDPVVVESMREKATSDNMCDVIENYAAVCAHFSECSRWKWMLEDDRNGCSCTNFEYESVGGDGVNPLCDLDLVEDEELECPFAKNLKN